MFEGVQFVPVIWPWKKDADERTWTGCRVHQSARRANCVARIGAALPDPCLVLDAHGVVVSANRQALELFEFDPTGKHFSAAIRSPAILEAVAQVCATGEPMRADYELRVPIPAQFRSLIAAITGRSRRACRADPVARPDARAADRAHARRFRRQCQP